MDVPVDVSVVEEVPEELDVCVPVHEGLGV